jgi:UDP-glucose 4-epimerase
VLNVGTGRGVSIAQLLELVEIVTGRPIAIDRRPARGFDVNGIVLDVSAIANAIDWHPLAIEEGLALCWETVPA